MSEERHAYGTDVLGREFELPGFRGLLLDMESEARRLPGRRGDRFRAEWLLDYMSVHGLVRIEIETGGGRRMMCCRETQRSQRVWRF